MTCVMYGVCTIRAIYMEQFPTTVCVARKLEWKLNAAPKKHPPVTAVAGILGLCVHDFTCPSAVHTARKEYRTSAVEVRGEGLADSTG